MNHEHGHEHGGVNGSQVNGLPGPTEEELDAYQNQLTDEAIQDQVKVLNPPQLKHSHLHSNFPSYMY